MVQKLFFEVNFVSQNYFYFYLIVCFMNHKVKWLELFSKDVDEYRCNISKMSTENSKIFKITITLD